MAPSTRRTSAQALDGLLLALAQAGQAGLGRLTMLADPGFTGAPPFVSDGTPGSSGTMVVEYVAGGALAELRALAAPVGLQGIVLSRGLEDDASFASLAARQALDAIAPLRVLLAAELLTAVRALGPDAQLSPALVPVVDAVVGRGAVRHRPPGPGPHRRARESRRDRRRTPGTPTRGAARRARRPTRSERVVEWSQLVGVGHRGPVQDSRRPHGVLAQPPERG